ncbi:hypothetical protein HNP73_002002 [Amaricoccus macauensis]|uniref:Uncharacterized protein n=1 Tax=Amaricoccus macauensis TaxID=57001 RepID=A0A840SQD4_9RHOB|nr:hypothetical protein [Amaricoccus macauensis]MBB5222066.1 hypothetical protein [Amaricoccus macauensis]
MSGERGNDRMAGVADDWTFGAVGRDFICDGATVDTMLDGSGGDQFRTTGDAATSSAAAALMR